MDCPNGCNSMPRSCPINVGAKTFVEAKATEFERFDGIKSATGEVENGNPTLVFDINQSAYATDNHFRNRDAFESRGNTVVDDIGSGQVKLEFLSVNQVVTVMECPECETVYEPDTGEVFENPDRMY